MRYINHTSRLLQEGGFSSSRALYRRGRRRSSFTVADSTGKL